MDIACSSFVDWARVPADAGERRGPG